VQQDFDGPNLERMLGVLRRRAPWIVICLVLAAGAAFAYSKHQAKKYTATASVVFGDNPLNQQIAGLSSSGSNPTVQQASNLELVRLGNMAAKTASLLGDGLTEEKVGESVSVGEQGESNLVSVSATTISPVLAAKIANTYARQFVEEQRKANHQYFKSALALVNRQLATLPRQEKLGPAAVTLEERAETLEFLADQQYGSVQIAQEASVPTSPSSPKTSRNTVIGAVLGLLVGLGVALVLERLDRDRWIREPEDLETIYQLPLLGTISESAGHSGSARSNKDARAVLTPAEDEAFHLIRARLRFFNIDRDLRTVLITSAARGDGKTTIARHLAEVAARMGSRVLLLEADLRHPTLARQLDIQSGPGLPDVLIGTVSMEEATQSVDVQTPGAENVGGRTLDIIASGSALPSNPGELIESQAMAGMLQHAKSAYDLVVIDTPPLTAVSDAFPLLREVDGVVIVGRVGRSRRDAAERLHETLASSGAKQLGIIVNGAKSSSHNSYADSDTSEKQQPPSVALTNGASPSEESISHVNSCLVDMRS
jgi:capsular exopolysaccharide synthesis family protein